MFHCFIAIIVISVRRRLLPVRGAIGLYHDDDDDDDGCGGMTHPLRLGLLLLIITKFVKRTNSSKSSQRR